MPNPFEPMPEPKIEDITDSWLECTKCGKIVTNGKYLIDEKLLSWKCPDGHISKWEIDLSE